MSQRKFFQRVAVKPDWCFLLLLGFGVCNCLMVPTASGDEVEPNLGSEKLVGKWIGVAEPFDWLCVFVLNADGSAKMKLMEGKDGKPLTAAGQWSSDFGFQAKFQGDGIRFRIEAEPTTRSWDARAFLTRGKNEFEQPLLITDYQAFMQRLKQIDIPK